MLRELANKANWTVKAFWLVVYVLWALAYPKTWLVTFVIGFIIAITFRKIKIELIKNGVINEHSKYGYEK